VENQSLYCHYNALEICYERLKRSCLRFKMADSVSSTDAKLLKKLGGVGLVMTIIFTISVSLRWKYILLSFRGPSVPASTCKGKCPSAGLTADLSFLPRKNSSKTYWHLKTSVRHWFTPDEFYKKGIYPWRISWNLCLPLQNSTGFTPKEFPVSDLYPWRIHHFYSLPLKNSIGPYWGEGGYI